MLQNRKNEGLRVGDCKSELIHNVGTVKLFWFMNDPDKIRKKYLKTEAREEDLKFIPTQKMGSCVRLKNWIQSLNFHKSIFNSISEKATDKFICSLWNILVFVSKKTA